MTSDERPWWRAAMAAGLSGLLLVVAAALRFYRLDSLPQGLLYDEAHNALDALHILAGGRPVFLAGNFGREALFIYLQALSIALVGQTDWALRLVSAAIGTLTVPLTVLTARHLTTPRVGLLSGAWLALSLWHLIFSRVGLRAVALPLWTAAMGLCLWRSLTADTRSARLAWGGLAGLWLGLALHTYTAARVLPLLPLLFAGYLMAVHPPLWRRARAGFLVLGGTALVVALPLALYAWQHPTVFFARTAAVSVLNPEIHQGQPLRALGQTLLAFLAMFSLAGDPHWDRNLPGRPIFDPLSSALAALGLVRAVRGWRDPAMALLLLWLGVMSLPCLLAARDLPNFLRATGLLPALFILPALGADWLWALWERRAPGRWRRAPAALALLLGGLGTVQTAHDYFTVWAPASAVSAEFNSGRWAAVAAARRLVQAGQQPLLVAAGDPDDPLQRYALDHQPEARALFLVDGTRSLVFLPGKVPPAMLFSPVDRPPPDLWPQAWSDDAQVIARTPDGQPVVLVRQPVPPVPQPAYQRWLQAGDALDLLGYDRPAVARAGQPLTVRWYWRVRGPDRRDLYLTHQVFAPDGQRRAQRDLRFLVPAAWPPGTWGLTWTAIPLPPDLAPGLYRLHVALYDRATLVRLPLTEAGRPVGTHLDLPLPVHQAE